MKKFEEIVLLGTKFHKVRVEELINYVVKAAQINEKIIVGNVNVRAMNFACEFCWYRDFINKSSLEDVLKVKASQKLCESSDHDPNHCYVDKSL